MQSSSQVLAALSSQDQTISQCFESFCKAFRDYQVLRGSSVENERNFFNDQDFRMLISNIADLESNIERYLNGVDNAQHFENLRIRIADAVAGFERYFAIETQRFGVSSAMTANVTNVTVAFGVLKQKLRSLSLLPPQNTYADNNNERQQIANKRREYQEEISNQNDVSNQDHKNDDEEEPENSERSSRRMRL